MSNRKAVDKNQFRVFRWLLKYINALLIITPMNCNLLNELTNSRIKNLLLLCVRRDKSSSIFTLLP